MELYHRPSLEELADPDGRVVGANEVRRALLRGQARAVYLARDVERNKAASLEDLCAEQGVPVYQVQSMEELGAACGIPVRAAAAAVLKLR